METGSRHESRFLYLDGMRGVAALFIALLHGLQTLGRASGVHVPNAALAVDFFFCLSGFVIALSYSEKLAQGMRRQDFLRRRAIRLVPLVLFGLLMGGAIASLQSFRHGRGDLVQTLAISGLSLLMLPAGLLFAKQAFPTDNPVWSLFFEMVANLAFALVTIRSRGLGVVLTALLALVLAVVVYRFGSVDQLGFDSPASFLAGFARMAYPFAAGVLIHRFALFGIGRPIWSWIGLGALSVIFAWPFGSWIMDLVVIVVALPMIVIAGTARAGAPVAALLGIMGDLSYPFYIIHMPFLALFTQIPGVWALSARLPFVAIGLWIMLAAACALLLLRFLDRPLRRKLEQWAGMADKRQGCVDIPSSI